MYKRIEIQGNVREVGLFLDQNVLFDKSYYGILPLS